MATETHRAKGQYTNTAVKNNGKVEIFQRFTNILLHILMFIIIYNDLT